MKSCIYTIYVSIFSYDVYKVIYLSHHCSEKKFSFLKKYEKNEFQGESNVRGCRFSDTENSISNTLTNFIQ